MRIDHGDLTALLYLLRVDPASLGGPVSPLDLPGGATFFRGPHGLPLIGRADWNDCLNLNCFSSTPGESFQTTENQAGGVAESVFIAAQFVLYGTQYAIRAMKARGLFCSFERSSRLLRGQVHFRQLGEENVVVACLRFAIAFQG